MNISYANYSSFGKITKVPQLFVVKKTDNNKIKSLLAGIKSLELTIKEEVDSLDNGRASENKPVILKQLNEAKNRKRSIQNQKQIC